MLTPKPQICSYTPPALYDRPRIGLVERLGHNERTIPLPAEVVQEIFASIAPEEITAIPELDSFYASLCRFLAVERNAVLACHGADAGIGMLFQAYVDEGDEVVQVAPTYHRYREFCLLYGAKSVIVAFDSALRLDFSDYLKAITPLTRMAVLVNPNSPTGTTVDFDELAEAAAKTHAHNALLLIDEVYHHYYEVTALPLLKHYDNVVIARSLSKAFGAAGIRVGALVGNPTIIQELRKLCPRHEISALSARVAEYLLEHPEIMRDYVAASHESRHQLAAVLEPAGFEVMKSHAASVMIRLPDALDRAELAAALWDVGYEIGAGLPPPYERYVRVAVGPWAQMQHFADALLHTAGRLRGRFGTELTPPQR